MSRVPFTYQKYFGDRYTLRLNENWEHEFKCCFFLFVSFRGPSITEVYRYTLTIRLTRFPPANSRSALVITGFPSF